MIKINGQNIAASPATFQPMLFDLDAEEGTGRTADGYGFRTRVATKRQFELSWGLLPWPTISALLKQMRNSYFEMTYPDPETGKFETKTFSVGNRPAPFAVSKGNEIYWAGLKVTMTER
ncbi:hypothetical protein B1748_29150 [Paenibacillus sp. MY03]|uniref:DUF6711 family protein n=1 Tax=Paenibacillus sp. MY03 TaxID=302980 RepID=UPI000B3CDDDD|nr:hypothetical protein [Paenibacillus sp. MY03]OUS70304.1 hypothetical protein B1748_29150 [Paenibacillus sp. MY03]